MITVATNAIKKNIILACTPSTDIDSQNNRGLKVPNTENHIICLNAVIKSVATVNVKNNHIRFIGKSLAIKLSIK